MAHSRVVSKLIAVHQHIAMCSDRLEMSSAAEMKIVRRPG